MNDPHLVAGANAPLLLAGHPGRGDPRCSPVPHRLGKCCPRLHPHLFRTGRNRPADGPKGRSRWRRARAAASRPEATARPPAAGCRSVRRAPNMSFCPLVAASCAALAAAMIGRRRRTPARAWAPGVEGAGVDQRFEARLLMMRGSTRWRNRRESANGLSPRASTMCSDRLPDALDGADGVEDLAVAGREHRLRAVDRRRHDLDAVPWRLARNSLSLSVLPMT